MQPQLPSPSPFLVRLAGRRADLAAFEVRTVSRVLREHGRLLVATGDATRLASVTHTFDYLGAAPLGTLPFCPDEIVTSTYSVRTDAEHSVAAGLQRQIWRSLADPKVQLRQPDAELHAFVVANEVWWGRLLYRQTPLDFAERNVEQRPFARSIGLPAQVARCLVNLSGVEPGQGLLDPFCGTGSVLIEGALLGARVFGSDIGWPLVRGTQRNLDHYGLAGRVERIDATRLRDWGERFDAIVTDVPYGRSASLHGADMQDLYAAFLDSAASVLHTGGRAVVVAPKDSLPLPRSGLRLLAAFDEYVHSKLTRTISVFQRSE